MKSFFGSLLLILGTIVASLAAASNERPWKPIPLDEVALDDPEVLLYDDILPTAEDAAAEAAVEGEAAQEAGELEPVARRDGPVTAAAIAALREAGEATVRVRKLPHDDEEIEVTPELGGRILAETLWVDLSSEALLTRAEADARLEAEAAARASLSEDADSAESSTAEPSAAEASASEPLNSDSDAEEVGEPATVDATVLADLERVAGDARLAGLPPMRQRYRSGRFIDAEVATFLREGGRVKVSVDVPAPPFEFGEWAGRVPFLLGVGAMLGGVVLMRSGRREALVLEQDRDDDEASPAELLASIAGAVGSLSADRETLDADALLNRADVILNRDCTAFVEGRDALRLQLGGAKYAGVMAAFSTGERRLSRAWSAAADGYLDEARTSLEESVEPFEEAAAALGALETSPAPEATENFRSATEDPDNPSDTPPETLDD